MHEVCLTVHPVVRKVGRSAEYRLRNFVTVDDSAQYDEFVVEYLACEAASLSAFWDLFQIFFILLGLLVPLLGVINDPQINTSLLRGVYGVYDVLQLILIYRDIKRPVGVLGLFYETDNRLLNTAAKPDQSVRSHGHSLLFS